MLGISKVFCQNKKTIIFIIGLGLFLSFTPLHSVNAAWWNDLIGGISGVVDTLLGLPLLLAIYPIVIALGFIAPILSFIIFTVSLLFLKWVTEGYLITLQFTHGGIVDQGLAATTTLANLFFVLILVFVALATILRLESYGLKKLVPKFLFVVLLINFIPVISGAIIDIANIITKSFLDFDITQTFIQIFNPFQGDINRIRDSIQGDWSALVGEIRSILSLSGIIERILTGMLISLFGLFAAFIFGLYFILFLLRYVVIWILVILAPIAWASWILPSTQKYWKMWWDYFLQWAFIGAIAGFFLKLGGLAVSSFATGFGEITTPVICTGGCWQQIIVGLFGFFFESINAIFLYGAIIIFLVIGFILSLKLSGGATTMILKWGEKGLKATGKWAKEKGFNAARERIAGSKGIQQFAQRMATAPTPGTGTPGLRGALARTTAAPLWALARKGEAIMGPELIQRQRALIDQKEKDFAGKTIDFQLAAFSQAGTDAERLSVINAITKDRNIDDALDPSRTGHITNAQINELYGTAQRYDKTGVLRSAFPELARANLPAAIGTTPPNVPPPGVSVDQYRAQYIFDRIKPADYENMSRRVIGDPSRGVAGDNEFLEAIWRRGTGDHVNKLVGRFGIDGALALEQRIQALAAAQKVNPRVWLQSIGNQRLLNYFTAGAGQGLIQI
jgi:hypothetical protein